MNGISAFIKGFREIPCPFYHVRIQQEIWPGRGPCSLVFCYSSTNGPRQLDNGQHKTVLPEEREVTVLTYFLEPFLNHSERRRNPSRVSWSHWIEETDFGIGEANGTTLRTQEYLRGRSWSEKEYKKLSLGVP